MHLHMHSPADALHEVKHALSADEVKALTGVKDVEV